MLMLGGIKNGMSSIQYNERSDTPKKYARFKRIQIVK